MAVAPDLVGVIRQTMEQVETVDLEQVHMVVVGQVHGMVNQ